MTSTDQALPLSDSLKIEERIAVLSPFGTPHIGLIKASVNGGHWSIIDLGDPRSRGDALGLSALRAPQERGAHRSPSQYGESPRGMESSNTQTLRF